MKISFSGINVNLKTHLDWVTDLAYTLLSASASPDCIGAIEILYY